MAIRLSLPGWLITLLMAAQAFLLGRETQAKADAAATQAAAAKADKTVEDAARQVGAMTDDEVKGELDQWRSKP